MSSQSGAIALTGTASGGGTTDAYGIELNGQSGTRSITSTSGAISLTGVGGGTAGASNWGILQGGDHTIGSVTGAVTLTATGGFGSIDYSNNGSGTANRVGNGTSGTVTINADALSLDGALVNSGGLVAIRPRSAGRAIDLGSPPTPRRRWSCRTPNWTASPPARCASAARAPGRSPSAPACRRPTPPRCPW